MDIPAHIQTCWILFISLGNYGAWIYGVAKEQETLSRHMAKNHFFTVVVSFFMSLILIANYSHLLAKCKSFTLFACAWACNSVAVLSWFGLILFEWDNPLVCIVNTPSARCHLTFTFLFVLFAFLFVGHLFEERRYRWVAVWWMILCTITITCWGYLYFSETETKQNYICEYLTLFVYNTFWTWYMIDYVYYVSRAEAAPVNESFQDISGNVEIGSQKKLYTYIYQGGKETTESFSKR